MPLHDAYQDHNIERIAEARARDAAMTMAIGNNRTADWSGGRVYRDLLEEHDATVAMISDDLRDADPDAP